MGLDTMTSDYIYALENYEINETLDTDFYKSVEGAINSFLKKENFVCLDIKTGNMEHYPSLIEIVYTYSFVFENKVKYYTSYYYIYPVELGD